MAVLWAQIHLISYQRKKTEEIINPNWVREICRLIVDWKNTGNFRFLLQRVWMECNLAVNNMKSGIHTPSYWWLRLWDIVGMFCSAHHETLSTDRSLTVFNGPWRCLPLSNGTAKSGESLSDTRGAQTFIKLASWTWKQAPLCWNAHSKSWEYNFIERMLILSLQE